MTTIVLDEKSGAMPIRDIINQSTDDIIEFCQPSGEFIGTLTLNRVPSPEQYAKLIAAAEGDIDVLRRRAYCSKPAISTASCSASF
jgi:hypothetical protein